MPLYMAHTCPRAVSMSQACGLRFAGSAGQQQRSPLLARAPSSRTGRAQRLSVQAGNTSGGPRATPFFGLHQQAVPHVTVIRDMQSA